MSQTRAAETERLSSLDRVLDQQPHGAELGSELFSVTDLLDGEVTLRRALTDPSQEGERRAALARTVLTGKVSPAALAVVEAGARQRWSGPNTFVAALERQAVRAELLAANEKGALDQVEDELFRFVRLVAANGELRDALAQQYSDLEGRQALVSKLLDGRADPITVGLARRAVKARTRTFHDTAEGYLSLAAQLRDRVVATVRVARPLPADQVERLRVALGRQVGHQVDLRVVVEPDLLGGVRVEIGDEVIEGTVAGRLQQAERRIA
ncbi:F0F1 ATP synthase subunit delta [Propioniferax innocua]|uniref:ATP synthase subunit delta n=1 Tax=Propioniferax innocua TaxID=1753 RepID=A0A542ZB68_9ACTN|nr:F0F1 ATP synthase subunit delta [Propioniferax innocua]TQL57587.1 F-type H+-transporting ATPase subunit delta [Propioniferax innocua]